MSNSFYKFFISFLFLTFGIAKISNATIYYVSTTGSDANTGTSWANPVLTVAKALSLATAAGDQVWVKKGTYTNAAGVAGNLTMSYASVGLYGGFAGTETLLSQAKPDVNVTTLMGNGAEVLDVYNTSDIISGFTITGGSGIWGGGIYNTKAGTVISHVIFSSNTSTSNGSGFGGGGIYNKFAGSTVDVSYSSFLNNTAFLGGAYFGYNGTGSSFTNCLFQGNTASISGGACYYSGGALANTIINSAFVSNSSPLGSAIEDNGNTTALGLTNTTFSANTTGAAIDQTGAPLNIVNSIIYGNSSGISGTGTNTITYSDIQADGRYPTLPTGTGNINSNPNFTSPTNPTLTLGSPAINSGLNSANATTVDLLNDKRIFNTTIDMGAYEFGAPYLATTWINVQGNINTSGNGVIKWTVAEENNVSFTLQKSLDGINFTTVSTVQSKGNGTNTYSIIDNSVLNTITYYRVYQLSLNGDKFYSKTIALSNKNIGHVTIYNNPTTNYLQIGLPENLINTSAQLYDNNGKYLQTYLFNNKFFTVDLTKYNSGYYFLKTINGTEKILKQ